MLVSVNCQVPLVVVVVLVKMGSQLAGNARLVVAQIRVEVFGNPAKLKVTFPFVPRMMLLTRGVMTVRDATRLVVLPRVGHAH